MISLKSPLRSIHALSVSRKNRFAQLSKIPNFKTMLTEDLKKLTKSEKLLLINDLWDDITQDPTDIPLTSYQEKKLDQRYAEFLDNPDEGKTWESFKKELKEKV